MTKSTYESENHYDSPCNCDNIHNVVNNSNMHAPSEKNVLGPGGSKVT